MTEHRHIVIIGAGFGGIGLVIKLREAGFQDILVLERADDVGGTWQHNNYPGCACDVPSHLYSFSFEPKPNWSRIYGRRDEILGYARSVAARHDVGRDVRFGCEMLSARWDDDSRRWELVTTNGSLSADILISAVGPFGRPTTPDFPGLGSFAGKIMHSFEWDHDYDLSGKRVAVIGTGASAVQIIPEIQPLVGHLRVFQRTPCWIMPRFDWHTSPAERRLARVRVLRKSIRALQYALYESYGTFNFIDNRFAYLFEAVARTYLRLQVPDAGLRRKLTPTYRIGCKRAAVSSNYLPTFTRPNVELVTDGIQEIQQDCVVTADGTEHRVDVIVLATGFGLRHRMADEIVGVGGRTLADAYDARPQGYLGTAVSGFPNLLFTSGPFGGAANQSFIYMLESQFGFIVDALTRMRRDRIATLEVNAQAQENFVLEAERRSENTIWLKGGCSGYYTTADGKRNAGLWPDWSFNYRRRTRRFDPDDFDLDLRPAIAARTAPAPTRKGL
ncbi:monooxygenase [Mycolicibacterium setense]|uniref:flavin-containing monooxygenase n=1 Tax=Mycolicibacterium setense TaxID=431269 RepID=UPI0007EA3547|nr:NAD(P)/FAD-dependent oxidoreductase [Mycolicibacterium setense]OBB16086.1 monooxygenase [Mycolicibacterium setense]